MKRVLAFLSAAALVASGPVAAQTRSAPAPASAGVERSGAEMEDANELRRGFLLPAVIIALILAILAVTDTWPFDEDPESP